MLSNDDDSLTRTQCGPSQRRMRVPLFGSGHDEHAYLVLITPSDKTRRLQRGLLHIVTGLRTKPRTEPNPEWVGHSGRRIISRSAGVQSALAPTLTGP
jgi:hypothetical protein